MGVPNGYTSAQVVQGIPIPSGIIQVVQTFKSNTFTSTSTSYVDITDLSVTITPTSSSNKILIMSVVNGSGVSAQGSLSLQLLRGATVIGSGDTAGSRSAGYVEIDASTGSNHPSTGIYLDSPATTSATTYKIQAKMVAGSGTWAINRSPTDTDNVAYQRTSSTITVMEVKV